jgi:type IV pilus assembly protein PilA
MKQSTTQGFTLIELMIVVAIIGILAAIAIPAYENYIAKAQFTEALSLASGQKTDVISYYSENDACPANGEAGIPAAGSISGKYVSQVAVSGDTTGAPASGDTTCMITATFNTAGVNSKLAGQQVFLTLYSNGGSFSWDCSTTASQSVAPSSCKGA